MSMFWDRFLRKRHSEPRRTSSSEWYERLANLFREHRGSEFTFDLLYREVHPPSPEALAAALTQLVDSGLVRQIIRVESPTQHGSIGDYSSIEEVPLEIHDWRADQDIRITPSDLHVLYTP